MKSEKRIFRKLKWLLGGGSLLIVLLVAGYGALEYWKGYEAARALAYRLDELDERQKRFAHSPQIDDCLQIVESVGFGLKEYSSAIDYGKRCLELPRPKERLDWLIHFWLANLYNRINDTRLAKEHLTSALQLDKNKMITENGWIESEGLGSIYRQSKP